MRAIVLDGPTESKDMTIVDVPRPVVKSGWILVRVMGFGINHSEKILREEEISQDYIQKPVIPGIECVGIVADPSDTDLITGQKIMAMMGGMGRSFDGSYAEYALLPRHHVFTVETDLPWDRLAAIPETYFTAWGSLFDCLHIEKGETLLIRGATCALGYASIKLAKARGCHVIATTHKREKLHLLSEADESILDDGTLEIKGIAKALELVGPKTLLDTLSVMSPGGIVCSTGILGGIFSLNGFDPIKDIPNGVYLTGFFSNYPEQETVDKMMSFIERHQIIPDIGATFGFSDIRKACIAQDEGIDGKIVITFAEGEP